jgi:hypothetical protein
VRSCCLSVFRRRAAMRRKRLDFLRRYFIIVSLVNKQGLETRRHRGTSQHARSAPKGLVFTGSRAVYLARPFFTETVMVLGKSRFVCRGVDNASTRELPQLMPLCTAWTRYRSPS